MEFIILFYICMKHTLIIFCLCLNSIYVGGDVETESTGVQGSPIQSEKQESLNKVQEEN